MNMHDKEQRDGKDKIKRKFNKKRMSEKIKSMKDRPNEKEDKLNYFFYRRSKIILSQ